MSVVRMKAGETEARPHSGGGMDRVVEKKGLPQKVKLGIGVGLLMLAAGGFYAYAPSAETQTVAADRITISPVTRGRFDDFLPLRARVTPLRARVTPLVTVFLDAVEGGRVEKVLVEDGAVVSQGQLLAVMSNSDLQLSLLARQADVSREVNSMRSQELALSVTSMSDERAVIDAELTADKARRQYETQKPLHERGFISTKAFNDSRDEYQSALRRAQVLKRAQATNKRLQTSQLAQLRTSNNSLAGSLDIARLTLDSLNIRAPVTGQLTAFSIQVGQSMNRGERLGQIDSSGRNKLVAQVDEFYLGRVEPGQIATADWGGKNYRLKVAKIYPQVKNGTFEVDLQFVGAEPPELQRGQTLQTKLTLGDPTPALLIPNGAFYNETGGSWVFVVTPDGTEAVKRQVRLGRRNADHIEVLEGLEPGEKVLTSPYTGFADKDRLDLQTK